MAERQTGLVHLYCGDGKGKTTAAMGLAMRAAGRGLRVLIVQFLKSTQTGELEILKLLPQVKVLRSSEHLGFTFRMNEEQKRRAAAIQQQLFAGAKEQMQDTDLLILDEVMAAINAGMLQTEQVAGLLRERPAGLEVVLTGRNPPPELIELADYISEIKKVKHPFDKGIAARDGIER